MASGGEEDILEQLVAKYIEAGFPPEQAQAMAMQELQQMVAQSGQGEGIASPCLMAKITQALTRASKEYDQRTLQSLIRDLDGVINKLNTSFQEELRQEIEAQTFFVE